MTVIIDGTAGITFPNSTTQASAGQVLQVVNATYSTEVSTSGTTFVTTNLTASITPKFATSKILVIVSLGDVGANNATSGNGASFNLTRNGGQIGANFGSQWGLNNGAQFTIISGGFSYLDSPTTTSSTAYLVNFKCHDSGRTVYCFRDNTQGSITLMEIAQ